MPIRTWNEALHRVNLKIVDVERVHVLVYHIFAYLVGLLRDMVIILDIVLDLGWLHLDVDLERLEAVLIRTLIEALHRVNLKKKLMLNEFLLFSFIIFLHIWQVYSEIWLSPSPSFSPPSSLFFS